MPRRAALLISAALLLPCLLPAQSTPFAEREALARKHLVTDIDQRRFGHQQFWNAIAPSLASPDLRVTDVGKSMHGHALRTITFGNGPITVLLWSQMHGDEVTATMALADVFSVLAGETGLPLRQRIAEQLTVTFLPMLNPDGAAVFQRHNAAGIDINRDARRLASPEARTLKAVRDRIEPDFGFNLHDQGARTRAGRSGEQVAIALLPPAYNDEREYNDVRTRARLVAAWLAADFAHAVQGHIAKYDDSFNERAFGDLMQTWGTSTVLIESGAIAGDPEKQELRTLNAAAMLGVLEAIATGDYAEADPDDYEDLPFNAGGAYDLLVRGGMLALPGLEPIRVDIAINFDDSVARLGGTVRESGDLETAQALDTLDLAGRFIHPDPTTLSRHEGRAFLPIGAVARFTIRQSADPNSAEVSRVP